MSSVHNPASQQPQTLLERGVGRGRARFTRPKKEKSLANGSAERVLCPDPLHPRHRSEMSSANLRSNDDSGRTACSADFQPSTRNAFTPAALVAVDLFSGAGGLSFAFHAEGFRIAACVENDHDAVATYRHSFVGRYSPQTHVIDADIRSPGVPFQIQQALASSSPDLVIGGPPCQDFSVTRRVDQLRSTKRMQLLRDYFRVLAVLQPRAFLFENVPGLLETESGRHLRYLRTRASSLRYRLHIAELDAAEYLVPQRRRRLFVVGIHKGVGRAFEFPEPSAKRVTVREAIAALKPLAAGRRDAADVDHRARNHRPDIVDYIKHIPRAGSWRDARDVRMLDCHRNHNGHWDVYGRMHYDEVAPTITGGCTNPSRGRFIHPTANRGITIREAALLQTFPPDWHFCGGIESASQQVGNAVPVLLGRALARSLRESLSLQL